MQMLLEVIRWSFVIGFSSVIGFIAFIGGGALALVICFIFLDKLSNLSNQTLTHEEDK